MRTYFNRRDFLTSASAGVAVAAGTKLQGQAPAKLVPPPDALIQVACAISKGTTEIDWIGPQAVFQSWHRAPGAKRPVPRFKIFTVSESREPVDARIPDYTFETCPPPHVVVVPAQTGSPALLDWLRKVHATADVTMSVCVGVHHLAKAGLLDGKTATTHHESIDQFEKEFPAVKWIRGVRYVEHDRISTGGGLTAGVDLALHVVERYLGRPAAQSVADHLEYDGKRWMTG